LPTGAAAGSCSVVIAAGGNCSIACTDPTHDVAGAPYSCRAPDDPASLRHWDRKLTGSQTCIIGVCPRTGFLSPDPSALSCCACVKGTCPPLSAPLHGKLGACGNSVGATCKFECDSGYELQGTAPTCQDTRQWSVSPQTCQSRYPLCIPLRNSVVLRAAVSPCAPKTVTVTADPETQVLNHFVNLVCCSCWFVFSERVSHH
jgi:hypothetical protein